MLGACVFVNCPLSVWMMLWLRAPSRGQAELVECVRLLDHRRHRDLLLRHDTGGGALHTHMTMVVTAFAVCPWPVLPEPSQHAERPRQPRDRGRPLGCLIG